MLIFFYLLMSLGGLVVMAVGCRLLVRGLRGFKRRPSLKDPLDAELAALWRSEGQHIIGQQIDSGATTRPGPLG